MEGGREREVIDFSAITSSTNYPAKYIPQRTLIRSMDDHIGNILSLSSPLSLLRFPEKYLLINTRRIKRPSAALAAVCVSGFNCFPINYSDRDGASSRRGSGSDSTDARKKFTIQHIYIYIYSVRSERSRIQASPSRMLRNHPRESIS